MVTDRFGFTGSFVMMFGILRLWVLSAELMARFPRLVLDFPLASLASVGSLPLSSSRSNARSDGKRPMGILVSRLEISGQ